MKTGKLAAWLFRAAALGALLAAFWPTAALKAAVAEGFEGRIICEDEVMPGVRIYAYRSFDELVARRPFKISSPSADNGWFELEVPSGTYYLAAKLRAASPEDGPLAPGDLFSYHGSNPIAVAPGKATHVGFILIRKRQEPIYEEIQEADSGSLAGTVTYQGEPLEGARLYLYLDGAENFRGNVYASVLPTGKTGSFRLDLLPDNDYYLIARKRISGAGPGPLSEGDYFGYFVDNPVRIRNGKLVRLTFEVGSKAGDIGREDSIFRESGTVVKGRITDREGKPVKGTYAFAYREKVMGLKRPAFISKEVDEKGNYSLYLFEGGTFYIGARSGYGEGPMMGEWYGRYDATADHSLKIRTGERIEGVDMTVEKIAR